MEKGLIHVYTGDGKGKTTAAIGLLTRARGHGLQTALAQFLKGRDTGELRTLENLSDVIILRYDHDYGFFSSAGEHNKTEIIRLNNSILTEARRLATNGLCDLLVLDEICIAYNYGAVDRELADDLIYNKPAGLELVLTGRGAPQGFLDFADYVTEFICRKHPYSKGIAARAGIEF